MDMNWHSMLHEAAKTSFEKSIETIDTADTDTFTFADLSQAKIQELSEKILHLPHQGIILLFSRYCFRLSPEETEMFFQMKNAKGRFRFYRNLLSSSMGLSSKQLLSDASLEQACKIALKEYLRTELKEDLVVYSGRKGQTHIVFKRIRRTVAVAAIILTLSFSTAMAANAQFREKVLTWVVETFEKYSIFELQSDGETVQPDLQSYQPTYLPDGAKMVDTIVQQEIVAYKFTINGSNSFEILISRSDNKVYLNTENAEIVPFEQNDVTGYSFQNTAINTNYVCCERDGCFLAVYGSIDTDELIKVAVGVTNK